MIEIVCTIDNNYVQHCGVMLCSLFSNSLSEKFHISIIHNGLKARNQQVLENFIHKLGQKASFIQINDSVLEGAVLSGHVTIATYFRILIPKLIDSSIKKILFLDSDIIVRGDVSLLWQSDITNYSHAAVKNPGISPEHLQELDIPANGDYFNAGVMLINLEIWRELEIDKKAIDFIREYPEKIKFWDQDVLNYLLQDRWLRIESKWNSQNLLFKEYSYQDLGIEKEEFEQARLNPILIHYVGAGISKPWYYYCDHPFKGEYYKYLLRTPWKSFRPIDKPSLKQRIKSKYSNTIKEIVTKLS